MSITGVNAPVTGTFGFSFQWLGARAVLTYHYLIWLPDI
jgi:hypothetical protein